MKKLVFLLSVLCLASCNKNDDSAMSGFTKEERAEAFSLRKDFQVPVKDGFTTIVTLNGDTVCTTDFATTIALPSYAVDAYNDSQTKSGGHSNVIEIYFVATNENGDNDFPIYKAKAERQQFILAFEDLEPGDNDYNDLILAYYEDIEAKYDKNLNKTTLWIKSHANPCAAGGTLNLDFGVDIYTRDSSGKFELFKSLDLYKDIHRTMLAGKGVNNLSDDPQKWAYNTGCNWIIEKDGKYVNKSGCFDKRFDVNETLEFEGHPFKEGRGFYFNYYIRVKSRSGQYMYKHYVAETSRAVGQYDYTIDGNGNAYGLLIPVENRETYVWPFETANIFLAYPDFKKWVERGSNKIYNDPFAKKDGRYLIPDINYNNIDIFDPAQSALFAEEKYAPYRPVKGGVVPSEPVNNNEMAQ